MKSYMKKIIVLVPLVLSAFLTSLLLKNHFAQKQQSAQKPNVILVMADDQGYGDLGCTGNPWIQTPNIDRFYEQSLRLTDYHTYPICTPSRGALMMGLRPQRTDAVGVGRQNVSADYPTMADVFAANGYATGLFGKWHLGDNYPFRPQDRGFEKTVAIKGGAIDHIPNYWGNSNFDGTYYDNGEPRKYTGYSTDIWFDEALRFIEEKKNQHQPFFAYIATNAPHSPFQVDESYAEPYRNNPDIPEPVFYGMIAKIDENFGRLRAKLQEWGIEDNTILIYTSDNGSVAGVETGRDEFVTKGYNAGMRGQKGSYYEGGHREPFFIRWPDGGLGKARDIDELSVITDVLPTLIELCGLTPPEGAKFDGVSLAAVLKGEKKQLPGDRIEFIAGDKLWKSVVLTRRWRLVNGTELYDIKADPQQRNNVAAQNPDVVKKLRNVNEEWWKGLGSSISKIYPTPLGTDIANPVDLSATDPVNHTGVIRANSSNKTGSWPVDFQKPGTYRFSLRRWPKELNLPVGACVDAKGCKAIHAVKARVDIFGKIYEVDVDANHDAVANLDIHVAKTGSTILLAQFIDASGKQYGTYYVDVERIGD